MEEIVTWADKMKGITFCGLATMFWGLGLFVPNLKAYITRDGKEMLQDDPSMLLISGGMGCSVLILFMCWPGGNFGTCFKGTYPDRIPWKVAAIGVIVGAFYGIANVAYYADAMSGMTASVLGPVSSIHVLVPPLFGLAIGRKLSLKTAIGFMFSIACLIALSGVLPGSAKEVGGGSAMPTPTQWIWVAILVFGWGFGMVIQENLGTAISAEQFPQGHLCFAIGYIIVFVVFAFCWETGIAEIANPYNWIYFGAPHIAMIVQGCFSGLGTGMFTMCLQFWPNLNIMTAFSSIYVIVPAVLGMACLHEPPAYNVFLGLVFAILSVLVLGLEVKSEGGEEEHKTAGGEYEPLVTNNVMAQVKISTPITLISPVLVSRKRRAQKLRTKRTTPGGGTAGGGVAGGREATRRFPGRPQLGDYGSRDPVAIGLTTVPLPMRKDKDGSTSPGSGDNVLSADGTALELLYQEDQRSDSPDELTLPPTAGNFRKVAA